MKDEAIREMRSVEDYHWWYAVLRQQVVSALRSRLKYGASLLDAGCGTGGMYAKIAGDWDCHGLDASSCAIQLCRERGWRKARLGDIHALPYESSSFSAVLSLDLLYHSTVVDYVAVAEMLRVIHPGGWLVIQVAAMPALEGSHDAQVCGARRYNLRRLETLLQLEGVVVEELYAWNFWVLPLLWLRRRFCQRPVSDLWLPPQWLNLTLLRLGLLEARLCRRVSWPWGSSLLAIIRKLS